MVWYGQNAGCALYFCNLSSELKETFDLQRPCGPKRRQKNNLKSNWQMFAETGVFRQFNNFFLPPHTNYSRPGKHPPHCKPVRACALRVAGCRWVGSAWEVPEAPPRPPTHTLCYAPRPYTVDDHAVMPPRSLGAHALLLATLLLAHSLLLAHALLKHLLAILLLTTCHSNAFILWPLIAPCASCHTKEEEVAIHSTEG